MKSLLSYFQSKSHSAESTLSLKDLESARARISNYIPPTSLTYSLPLSEFTGKEIFLKWENKLHTGSFKERGALNFLLLLDEQKRKRGVCAASAGNHALALSYYAAKLSIPCKIFMPKRAPIVKVSSTRKHGAEVQLIGDTFNEAYDYARELSKKEGLTFIPAFDHPAVIAGQGTIGLELHDQLPSFDAVVVPVGGGGLVAGLSAALKLSGRETYVLGVQSHWVTEMRNGAKTPSDAPLGPVTIADGIAVKQIGQYNAPLIAKYVDSLQTVTENEIASALLKYLELERTVVEGAGAAALAAVMAGHLPIAYKKVVVIVSGSNIDANMLSRLIDRSMAESSRVVRLTVSLPDAPGALTAVSTVIAKQGGNILQVDHDRSFAVTPAYVNVSFLLEVRDSGHTKEIINALETEGLRVTSEV